jgi:hypothetical protein
MPRKYVGCVYHRPPQGKFSAVGIDELRDIDLKAMKLTGLPIKATHRDHKHSTIGNITDEWQGADGSKYVEFEVNDYAERHITRGLYNDLSLNHDVHRNGRLAATEVSICNEGARPGTHIHKDAGVDNNEYKRMTLFATQSPTPIMSVEASAPPADVPQPAAPVVDRHADLAEKQQQALAIINGLPEDKQSIVKGAWKDAFNESGLLEKKAREYEAQLAEYQERDRERLQKGASQVADSFEDYVTWLHGEGKLTDEAAQSVAALKAQAQNDPAYVTGLAPLLKIAMSRRGKAGGSGYHDSSEMDIGSMMRASSRSAAAVAGAAVDAPMIDLWQPYSNTRGIAERAVKRMREN